MDCDYDGDCDSDYVYDCNYDCDCDCDCDCIGGSVATASTLRAGLQTHFWNALSSSSRLDTPSDTS